MLKPQDIVIALKILALNNADWTQHQLATWLFMSPSEIHAGIKRLTKSKIFILTYDLLKSKREIMRPRLEENALTDLLITVVKYVFPGEMSEVTRGIPTCHAAEGFPKHLIQDADVIPVWPYEKGNTRGQTFLPLYPSIPKSITDYPDRNFYKLLVSVDILRSPNSRIREQEAATKFIKTAIKSYYETKPSK